ncbi:hypothetical protein HG530_014601 [Fusarium avenaceum]|nr:hypothetical protein HG530_014601 [Fusarium avenaceum]
MEPCERLPPVVEYNCAEFLPVLSVKAIVEMSFRHRRQTESWGHISINTKPDLKEFGGFDLSALVLECTTRALQPFSNFWHPAGTALSKDVHSASRFTRIDINLTHPIYATQHVITHFTQNKKPGSIVHISSIAAQAPVLRLQRSVKWQSKSSTWLITILNHRTNNATQRRANIIISAAGAMMLLRAVIYTQLEAEWLMFNTATGKSSRQKLSDASRRYVTENAPAEYVDALVPKFETLHKPNLHLISDDLVERIGQRSVFLRLGKELLADTIMLATGFETTNLLAPMAIIDLEGKSIEDHWNQYNNRLPQAQFGIYMADFPNRFIMMGPNKLTGHLLATWSTEISPWSSRTVKAIEVKQQAEDNKKSWFQSNCKCLVWSSGCRNWYVEPIVNPRELSAHAHTAREDLSNYWIPNLCNRAPYGTLEDVPQTGGMLVYYLQRSDPKDPEYERGLLAFPEGLQMLAEVPYTYILNENAMYGCCVPVQFNEKTIGFLETLPGCNPVTFGPKPASPIAGEDVTIESCLDYCEREGYLFVGLEYGRECYCGNAVEKSKLPVKGQRGKCEIPYAGSKEQVCGGPDALSLNQKCKASEGSCKNA